MDITPNLAILHRILQYYTKSCNTTPKELGVFYQKCMGTLPLGMI